MSSAICATTLLVDEFTTAFVAGVDMCATPMTQPRKKWSVASGQWLERNPHTPEGSLATSHQPLATALRPAITVAGAVVRRPSQQGSSQHFHVVGLIISDIKGRPTKPRSPLRAVFVGAPSRRRFCVCWGDLARNGVAWWEDKSGCLC